MVEINRCTRKNFCVDCDDPDCIHAGDIEADCPKWKCDNPTMDCENCEFLKEYKEAMKKMSKELKPCPFCGGKAEQKETYKYVGLGKSIPQYYVRCGNSDCGLYVATCNRDTKEEAVEIWNRRVTE